MMYEQLFDEDPLTGTRRIFYRDPHEKTNTIVATQDVTDIVEENKAQYNASAGWKEAFNHVASIPIGLYFQLKKQGIVDDPARFKRWLNNSDNRAFRTKPGAI